MIKKTIERIELEGIHYRYDLDISFNPNLNILFGENGTGKSTLIHIIANIANGDFIRFAFLDFNKIKITYSDKHYLTIEKKENNDSTIIYISTKNGKNFEFSQREAIDVSRDMEDERYDSDYAPDLINRISDFIEHSEIPIIKTSYFPAFRTILEAWSTNRRRQINQPSFALRALGRDTLSKTATIFSRNLFGPFLPIINYPSPMEIEFRLNNEIRHCQLRIANYERSIFSDSFVKVFSALLEGTSYIDSNFSADSLIQDISALTNNFTNNKLGELQEDSNTYLELKKLVSKSEQTENLQGAAAEALVVYRDALKDRQFHQQESFKSIDTYFEIINSFLNNKQLDYRLDSRRKIPRIGLKFPDNTWSNINVMSSGERQLLTMLYAVNHMSDNSIVLIDEPEISLHIDWQENLLEKMMEQLEGRQIVVCTHSPAITANFTDYMIEVAPRFTNQLNKDSNFSSDESEDDGDEY